jgi:transcriptional regulator with PAS, ATPase and Fis domain
LERPVTLSRSEVERLRSFSWPGNVRQLKTEIKRVVLLSSPGHEVSEGELQLGASDMPGHVAG